MASHIFQGHTEVASYLHVLTLWCIVLCFTNYPPKVGRDPFDYLLMACKWTGKSTSVPVVPVPSALIYILLWEMF